MIKREHLKQAIDAIARRDPEIGYTLDEMLGTGRIDTLAAEAVPAGEEDLLFRFDQRRVRVRRYVFIQQGVAALEQHLVAEFGRMARELAIQRAGDPVSYLAAAREIRRDGLRAMVLHEIARAREGLREAGSDPRVARLGAWLERLPFQEADRLVGGAGDDPAATQGRPVFHGRVGDGRQALFAPFPFSLTSLVQVAELNLEFFHVRFMLDRLLEGSGDRLYAGIVSGRILGLAYLDFRPHVTGRDLEIKYIATASGAPAEDLPPELPRVRGVGTFMVAGVWLCWKSLYPDARRLVLDSEIGAMHFYESLGFQSAGRFQYALRAPRGFLLEALLSMLNHTRHPDPGALADFCRAMGDEVRQLKRTFWGRAGGLRREARLAFVKACLRSDVHPEIAGGALRALLRGQGRIPEFDELLSFTRTHGRIRIVESAAAAPPAPAPARPLVIQAPEFAGHLHQVFHLESARRLKTIAEVLQHPSLEGRWQPAAPRLATPEELAWVHSGDHVGRVAASAGQRLVHFDSDTQATAESYTVARLAVGGVFALLDGIMEGPCPRGFAVVRPPGHHAGPDRPMGFCLFNNVALGACYLRRRWGLSRIMVVDIDAHHGNGTQEAFYDTDEVLFLSFHEYPAYPGTGHMREAGAGPGEGFTVNVPLDRGSGDREFARVLRWLAAPLAREYLPKAILVSCGFDLHQADPLAHLNGTGAGYALLTRLLCRIADEVCQGRIAFVLEGGYSTRGVREGALNVMQELCGVPAAPEADAERLGAQPPGRFTNLRKVLDLHAKYWRLGP